MTIFITLFGFMTVFCGTSIIPGYSHIQTECGEHLRIVCGILSVPRNIGLDLNKVMFKKQS